MAWRLRGKMASVLGDRSGGFLDLVPDPQEIAAPEFGDVGLAVAAADQFGGDVACLADILPAVQAAAIVEVGADADVIDADFLTA